MKDSILRNKIQDIRIEVKGSKWGIQINGDFYTKLWQAEKGPIDRKLRKEYFRMSRRWIFRVSDWNNEAMKYARS